MEATPRPWGSFSGVRERTGIEVVFVQQEGVEGEFDGIIAEMPPASFPFDVHVANARLIVEAVNKYDAYRELVEAAEAVHDAIKTYSLDAPRLARLRAALGAGRVMGTR